MRKIDLDIVPMSFLQIPTFTQKMGKKKINGNKKPQNWFLNYTDVLRKALFRMKHSRRVNKAFAILKLMFKIAEKIQFIYELLQMLL